MAARQKATETRLRDGNDERLRGLSDEQKAVVRLARAGTSMLLTGAAGTGKSFTVSRLVGAVRADGRRVVVTASTGIAACAVGGVTLHAFSGVGDASRSVAQVALAASRNSRTVRRWRGADCLVIEEVSMVDAGLLERVDAVARACRGRDAPMGGLQTVLVGDFHQLPPVSRGPAAPFAFQSVVWPRLVRHTVVLRGVFRQSDGAFVGALNAVRSGVLGGEHRALLASRAVPDGASPPDAAVVLCPRNEEADAINVARLARLPGPATQYSASLTRARDASPSECASLERQLAKGCLAPESLQLRPGASVVLLTNLDASRGLVNGTRGVVTSCEDPAGPTVRFFTGGEAPPALGAAIAEALPAAPGARAAGKAGQAAAAPASIPAGVLEAACEGVPSLSMTVKRERFVVADGGSAWVARVQVPLRLAWALSIHKSQGMTIDTLWVRCGRIWEAGQAYVALSRARAPQGLYLEGFDAARHVRLHPRVAAFYAGLGSSSDAAILAAAQERRRARVRPRQPGRPAAAAEAAAAAAAASGAEVDAEDEAALLRLAAEPAGSGRGLGPAAPFRDDLEMRERKRIQTKDAPGAGPLTAQAVADALCRRKRARAAAKDKDRAPRPRLAPAPVRAAPKPKGLDAAIGDMLGWL